jgi:hypothetical protein
LPGRELSDTFNVRAFWRVAPSVRLSLRAIWAVGVFCRASDLSSRTSCAVQSRLFDFLTTMPSRVCSSSTSADSTNSHCQPPPESSSFCLRSRSFYCLQVDVEKRFVLFALLLALPAHPDHLSKDLNVEAFALGLAFSDVSFIVSMIVRASARASSGLSCGAMAANAGVRMSRRLGQHIPKPKVGVRVFPGPQ